jgi:hypothetical protein
MRSVAAVAFTAAVASSLGAACADPDSTLPEVGRRGVPASMSCVDPSDAGYYLPPEVLQPVGDYATFELRARYAQLLRAMKEPPLYCGPGVADGYRLAPLDWAGSPTVVRITRLKKGAALSLVKLEAPTWNVPPGEIVEARSRALSDPEWLALDAALEAADFWRIESTTGDIDAVSGEGLTWVLEGRRGRVYHVVSRSWGPFPSRSALRDAARLMLTLAGASESELGPDAPGVKMRPRRPQPGDPPPPPPPTARRSPGSRRSSSTK